MSPRRLPWSFLLLHLGLGLVSLFGSPSRFGALGFREIRRVGHVFDPDEPLTPWGIAFLIVAGLILLGTWQRDGRILMGAAILGGLLTTFVAVCIVATSFEPNGPLWGPVVFATIAFWHWRAVALGRMHVGDEWPPAA